MDLADLNAQELFGDAGDISSDEDDKTEKVVGEDGEEQVVRRVCEVFIMSTMFLKKII